MRILHVIHTPAGGPFRHVRDLARGQAAAGHEVGIMCDSTTGSVEAEAALGELAPLCLLGIHRLPIGRMPGVANVRAASAIAQVAAPLQPDIIHGHGARGGVHARLAGWRLKVASIYTPHGGSIHNEWNSLKGALLLSSEKLLLRFGSGLLFVCEHERSMFKRKIGLANLPHRVVHNGLWPEEFIRIVPTAVASDLLFLGEPSERKGLGDLLEAMNRLFSWRGLTATIVGDGPEREHFMAQAARLGLGRRVAFVGTKSPREAFSLGRLLVMPSRAESFPYVIVEAIAAEKPLVATRVGGIPEILESDRLVPPSAPMALAAAIKDRLTHYEAADRAARALAKALQPRLAADAMRARVDAFYGEVLADRPDLRTRPLPSEPPVG